MSSDRFDIIKNNGRYGGEESELVRGVVEGADKDRERDGRSALE